MQRGRPRSPRVPEKQVREVLFQRLTSLGLNADHFNEPRCDGRKGKIRLHGRIEDPEGRFFKIGRSPFYVFFKCRGDESEFEPQHVEMSIWQDAMEDARSLGISGDSLYLILGFFLKTKRAEMGESHFFRGKKDCSPQLSSCQARHALWLL